MKLSSLNFYHPAPFASPARKKHPQYLLVNPEAQEVDRLNFARTPSPLEMMITCLPSDWKDRQERCRFATKEENTTANDEDKIRR